MNCLFTETIDQSFYPDGDHNWTFDDPPIGRVFIDVPASVVRADKNLHEMDSALGKIASCYSHVLWKVDMKVIRRLMLFSSLFLHI